MAESGDDNTELDKVDDLERRIRVLRPNLKYNRDPEFLLRFIRARKGCVDRAFTLLCNYYDARERFPDLFYKFRPSAAQDSFESGVVAVLPQCDFDGRRIIVIKPGNWNPSKTSVLDCIRACLMAVELVLVEMLSQRNGVIFIVDLQTFGLNHISKVTPSVLRILNTLFRDCYPVRVKGIHFLYQPMLFSMLYAAFSSFLKPKLRSRIKIHGVDMMSLHQDVSRDILPKDYDGKQSYIDQRSWTETIIDSEANNPSLWT